MRCPSLIHRGTARSLPILQRRRRKLTRFYDGVLPILIGQDLHRWQQYTGEVRVQEKRLWLDSIYRVPLSKPHTARGELQPQIPSMPRQDPIDQIWVSHLLLNEP